MNEQLKQAIDDTLSNYNEPESRLYLFNKGIVEALQNPNLLCHADPEIMKLAGWVREEEWYDMDSAPKDGTEILIYEEPPHERLYKPEPRIALCRWDIDNRFYSKEPDAWCIGSEQDEQGGHDTVDFPKKWKPLPQPPKQ